MNSKRLIYIAGLSDDPKIGDYIKQDFDNMKSIFETYENEGQIILRTDEIVTTKLLVDRLSDHKILPWLFYFSGHSNKNNIKFSDGAISKENFAGLFKSKKVRDTLNLVFLGSCESTEIGEVLINNRVKVVITSNSKVPAHLANTISKDFFNQFLFCDTLQEAFDRTRNSYQIRRNKFGIQDNIEFPWRILSSSESNLAKLLPSIKMSSEQKHQILLNSTSIQLDYIDYYLESDIPGKNSDLLKKEKTDIKKNLKTALKLVRPNENMGTLIKVWDKSAPLETVYNKNRFLRTQKKVKNLDNPELFIQKTKSRLNNLIRQSTSYGTTTNKFKLKK